jgi:hypothetical protein
MSSSREIEPTVESIVFIGGDPTVLTDILPIGLASYLCHYPLLKIAVGAVV